MFSFTFTLSTHYPTRQCPQKESNEFLIEMFGRNLKTARMLPDLNPIDNIWGMLESRVYANNRHIHTSDEVKAATIAEWNFLEVFLYKKLLNSMKKLFSYLFSYIENLNVSVHRSSPSIFIQNINVF